MKTSNIIFASLMMAGIPAQASPFTLRMLPSGYSAKIVSGSGQIYSPEPVVADIGWVRPVWYGGGLNFSTFPYSPNPIGGQFTLPLPVLTMPQFPGMAEVPLAGVLHDVDRDGDLDLIRMNAWDGWDSRDTLQVFLNQGNGTFLTGYRLDVDIPVFPDSHARHYHIACADFDGDGDPDLSILGVPDDVNRSTTPWSYPGTLTVRWNDGTGLFPTSTVLRGSGFSEYAAMAVADLDRDGDADILCDGFTVPTGNDTVQINTILFKNSGVGTFTQTNVGDVPARLTDFNNDGWLDAGFYDDAAMNNGAGVLDTLPYNTTFRGAGVKNYAYADADGDGTIDYLYNEGGKLVYRRGSGSGIYAGVVPLVSLPSPAAAIGAGDADCDGDTDFLVHLENGSSAFVENRTLHQEAGATLAGSVSIHGVTQLHAADFDRDGFEDLVAVQPAQKQLRILFGQEEGTLSAPVLFRNLDSAPHSAAVGDFDQDGRIDVAYTQPGAGEVRLARNTSGVVISWPDSALATGLAGVSLLDTGNLGTPGGPPDLLTGNGTTGQLRWLYRSGGIWNGQTVLSSSSPLPGALLAANAANRPGDEVLTLGANAAAVSLRAYQLNPAWVPLGTDLNNTVSSNPPAEVMVWADVTGDLRNEIVFVKGDGALGFYHPVTATGGTIGAAGGAIRAVTAVDWDRDGRTDFLCATDNGVSLFTWKGAWLHKNLLSYGAVDSITAIDLNRDGWMDAVAGTTGSGFIHFIRNTPRALVAQNTSPPEVTLTNGQAGVTAAFTAISKGEPADATWNSLADVDGYITTAKVSFYRAVANGAAWEKGTILTASELSQAVTSIALVSNNTVIGTASPSSLAGGQAALGFAAGSGTLVPIAPGATQTHHIRLTLTATASQSAFKKFFVELSPGIQATIDNRLSYDKPIPLSGQQSVLVTAMPVLTPLQQWRLANLGTYESTGAAANDADPDGDGIPNLLEYVSSQNPNSATGIGAGPVVGLSRDTGLNLMIADLRLLTAYDSRVRLTLQYSLNPSAGWSQLSTRTGTGAWSLAPMSTTLLSGGGRTRFNFNGGNPTIFPKAFYRLKAEELP